MKSSALVDRKFSGCELCQMAMQMTMPTGMISKAVHPAFPLTVIIPINRPTIVPAISIASIDIGAFVSRRQTNAITARTDFLLPPPPPQAVEWGGGTISPLPLRERSRDARSAARERGAFVGALETPLPARAAPESDLSRKGRGEFQAAALTRTNPAATAKAINRSIHAASVGGQGGNNPQSATKRGSRSR
jgi:hypothetical protein